MDRVAGDGPAFHSDWKEYTRFCRFHGLFLVDGLDAWRAALKSRGLSDFEVGAKVSAARDLVRRLAEPSSDLQGA
jgi:hypothetical protein